jgi:hypothetical protein
VCDVLHEARQSAAVERHVVVDHEEVGDVGRGECEGQLEYLCHHILEFHASLGDERVHRRVEQQRFVGGGGEGGAVRAERLVEL